MVTDTQTDGQTERLPYPLRMRQGLIIIILLLCDSHTLINGIMAQKIKLIALYILTQLFIPLNIRQLNIKQY